MVKKIKNDRDKQQLIMLLLVTIAFLMGLLIYQSIKITELNKEADLRASYATIDGINIWNTQIIESVRERNQLPLIVNNRTYFIDMEDFCNGTTTPD